MSSQGQNVGISGHNFKRGVIADQAVAIDEDWFNAPIPLFIQSDYTILITFHGALDTSSVLEYTRNGTDYFELNSGEVVNAGQDFHLTIVAVTGDVINIRAKTALEIKYLIVEANYDEALLNFPVAGVSGGAGALHDLLSSTHPDTTPGAPSKGAVIRGVDTVKWEKIVGAIGQFLQVDGSGDVIWGAAPTATITPWTSDIDAAGFSLLNMAFLEQNEIAEPTTPAAGKVRIWSELDSGFSLLKYKGSNGIVNSLIQEDIFLVRNITGVTILKGSAVYFNGTQGNKVTIALAQSNNNTTMPAIGFVLEDIPHNTNGPVIARGRQTNLNTSAFSTGDVLYVSPSVAGGVTTTKPPHPNVSQVMGVVVVDNPTTGEVDVIVGTPKGAEDGTNLNTYLIGDALAGTKELGFVDNVGTQFVRVNNALFSVDLITGSDFKITINSIDRVVGDDTNINVTDLNLIMDGGYAEISEIVEPASPAADKARFWLDAAVIINDHPRLVLKDENGVNFDLSSAGMVVNTYNTEAIGNNHYLALSGLNSSNGTFVNRAIVLPRATRFYNLYIVITTNATTIVTNIALNDAAASPTILDVDIPIGTTGTFANVDDFVDLPAATECAYGFGLTTGGSLTVASVGMAMDQLRLQ